jgi:hypothetical protein
MEGVAIARVRCKNPVDVFLTMIIFALSFLVFQQIHTRSTRKDPFLFWRVSKFRS